MSFHETLVPSENLFPTNYFPSDAHHLDSLTIRSRGAQNPAAKDVASLIVSKQKTTFDILGVVFCFLTDYVSAITREQR